MQERLKQIWTRIVEFWNKYSVKQKTITISVIAVITIAILALSFTLSQTDYVPLIKAEDTKATSSVVDLLEAEGITYKVGADNLSVSVDKTKYTDAVLLIGKSDIAGSGMSYEDALNNDMSTSESEKQTKLTLALQNTLRQSLMNMEGIKDAIVYVHQPVDRFTIITENAQASVSAILTMTSNTVMTKENASYIASFLANVVGNSNTDNIKIIDSTGNLLFGGTSELLGGTITSNVEYKQKLTNNIINNVQQVLLKYGTYNDVTVGASNIKFNMDVVTQLVTEYTPAEGQEQGLLNSRYTYKAEGDNAVGGAPGTDTNEDDTQYEVENGSQGGGKVETVKEDFLPNQTQTNIEKEVGAVLPDDSSMAIILTSYKTYRQEDVERQGLLEETTWEDYVLATDVKTKTEVDDQVYDLVSAATGIDKKNISITAWEQPIFESIIEEATDFSFIIMVVLAVLILALLVFVVLKSTKPVEVTEREPELSVEEMLATTRENQNLDDIEYGDKSETRRLIEKFVEENPEAVASLLRNWLSDDWG